jgi:hypothetical protein
MDQDSVRYDSLDNRPLPKWLTDQNEGLTTYQPPKIIIKEDKSLYVSFGLTTLIIILIVTFLTVTIIKKKKNHIK